MAAKLEIDVRGIRRAATHPKQYPTATYHHPAATTAISPQHANLHLKYNPSTRLTHIEMKNVYYIRYSFICDLIKLLVLRAWLSPYFKKCQISQESLVVCKALNHLATQKQYAPPARRRFLRVHRTCATGVFLVRNVWVARIEQ